MPIMFLKARWVVPQGFAPDPPRASSVKAHFCPYIPLPAGAKSIIHIDTKKVPLVETPSHAVCVILSLTEVSAFKDKYIKLGVNVD